MATAKDVLDVARSQLGVAENPPGSNQVMYAYWAGIPGQPWCGAFVCWCLDQAGALDVPRFVWTPSGAQAYQAAGRWSSVPAIGSVVFFQWPGVPRICHVGFVEVVRPDGVVTIEGNTDEAGGGSGGKVMRHVRRANIVGYGHPTYEATAPAIPIAAATRPMLRMGAKGEQVRVLQQKLRATGAYGLAVDGAFGPKTDQAVRTFQRHRGLVVDGIVGPKTWAALG